MLVFLYDYLQAVPWTRDVVDLPALGLQQKDVLSRGVHRRKGEHFLQCPYGRKGGGSYSSIDFPTKSPLYSLLEGRCMRICPIHAAACQ